MTVVAGLQVVHVGSVKPDVGLLSGDLPTENGLYSLFDLFADARHLTLGDPGHTQGIDQIVHFAGADAVDVGLLDHGYQGLLTRLLGSRNEGK